MTLPASGTISFDNIKNEIALPSISMNNPFVRGLVGLPESTTVSLSNFYSKTSGILFENLRSTRLNMVASNGTIYVIVGQSGVIVTSTDLTTFTRRTSGTTAVLVSVIFANNLFVASGTSGTILTSSDGITWTARTSGTAQAIVRMAWSGSLFVGAASATGTYVTSPDGITWTVRTIAGASTLTFVTWSGSQFLMGGLGATFYTSSNGTTWTSRATGTTGTSLQYFDAAFATGLFVAVGYYRSGAPTVSILITSPDGITWTTRVSGSGTGTGMLGVSYNGTTWLASGSDASSRRTSTNGTTWSSVTFSPPMTTGRETTNGGYPAIRAIGSTFFQPTFSSNLFTSTDGTNFTQRTNLPISSTQSIVTNSNTFVCTDQRYVYYSSNGLDWTQSNVPLNAITDGVLYFQNNIFFYMGNSGLLYTSSDGISWTARTTGVTFSLSGGVAFGAGLYVINGPAVNQVITSPDLVTWTTRTATSMGSAIARGSTRFVAQAFSLANTLVTSTDGINWSSTSTGGALYAPVSIIWTGSQFVAGGPSVTGGVPSIATSPDGLTWTDRSSGAFSAGLTSVGTIIHNPTQIGITIAGNIIVTSPDAITYTNRTSGNTYSITSGTRFANGSLYIFVTGGTSLLSSPAAIGQNWI